jgi:hypothetical protein
LLSVQGDQLGIRSDETRNQHTFPLPTRRRTRPGMQDVECSARLEFPSRHVFWNRRSWDSENSAFNINFVSYAYRERNMFNMQCWLT